MGVGPGLAPDAPGGLSIVVQGGLFRANREAVIDNLVRWRTAFPRAQLVCAVSSSDIGEDGEATQLADACDALVFAPAADALPPIKTDSRGPNHLNLQIAAARAGLAAATGRHVLRVRNDLTLARLPLLTLYARAQVVPRGGRALFAERVVAAQLFTLNPLTAQRMSFHVSDWFHLGLASDLRQLWHAAMPLTTADAAWYRTHPHAPGSNAAERRFLTRWPPEQAITFPVFAAAFPDLALAYHNDQTSAAASLCVVADNFAIADLAECRAKLAKYQRDIDRMSAFTRLECLSQAQLERIAGSPGRSVYSLLRPEVTAIARHDGRWARLRRTARRWSRRLLASR